MKEIKEKFCEYNTFETFNRDLLKTLEKAIYSVKLDMTSGICYSECSVSVSHYFER